MFEWDDERTITNTKIKRNKLSNWVDIVSVHTVTAADTITEYHAFAQLTQFPFFTCWNSNTHLIYFYFFLFVCLVVVDFYFI